MRRTILQCVLGPSVTDAVAGGGSGGAVPATVPEPAPNLDRSPSIDPDSFMQTVPSLRLPLSKRDDLAAHPVRIVWIRRATRRLLNEAYLLKLLPVALADTPHKLIITSFEHLDPNDQALLAATADVLIGVHGTALQWALLMRPGSVLLEIQSPLHRCTPTGLNHGGRVRCEFGRTTLAVGVEHMTWSVEASQVAKTFGESSNKNPRHDSEGNDAIAHVDAQSRDGDDSGGGDKTAAPNAAGAPITEAFKDLELDPDRFVFLLRRAVCRLQGRNTCDYGPSTPVDG
jgi:hypothetical protein